MLELDLVLKNKNHGIMTVKRCLSLDYFERHNDTGLRELGCEILDKEIIPEYARLVNPDIRTTCLKLPPRKSKEDIACQWEFTLGA